MSVSLAVNLAGLSMKNPVTVASGTFASGREYSDFFDIDQLGAITTKGVSEFGWEGNPSPRIAETASGMLNSIGLQNPGVKAFMAKDLPWLAEQQVPVIVNVSGHSIAEYCAVIDALEKSSVPGAYELNISCPNVDQGGLTFGTDPAMVEEVVSACRIRSDKPMLVKLTPNVTDIAEIARAAEAAGADGLSLINTVLGMAINPYTRKPLLARVVGGLSGPAIKPVALRCVWQCSQAVSIPILGMGGISNGLDAIEFMLAGATAVAVGAANFVDPTVSLKVINEMSDYCESQGIRDITELIGALEC